MSYDRELPTSEKLIDAAFSAEKAGKGFRVAYYLVRHSPSSADYHFNDGFVSLEKAARALGYTLTPLKEAQHVADTQDQPDGGRLNLRQESPAPFSENYGA